MDHKEWKSAGAIIGIVGVMIAAVALFNDLSGGSAPAPSPAPSSTQAAAPTTPIPTGPLTPTPSVPTPVGKLPGDDDNDGVVEDVRLTRIEIEDNGSRRVGDGKYNISSLGYATVGLHWKIYTNLGQVTKDDCEVVVTMTRSDGTPVGNVTRSASCATVGYQGGYHLEQPGSYRLNLKVTYQGDTLEQTKNITVYS